MFYKQETYLVTRDQLIAEGQARHQPSFLHPEYRGETSREEYPLNRRERHDTLAERRRFAADPLQRPVGLLLDAGKRFHGVE